MNSLLSKPNFLCLMNSWKILPLILQFKTILLCMVTVCAPVKCYKEENESGNRNGSVSQLVSDYAVSCCPETHAVSVWPNHMSCDCHVI